MAHLISIIACLFLCVACTPVTKAYNTIFGAGSQAADQILDSRVKQLCTAVSIGALERRYEKNPTQYQKYIDFCGHEMPVLADDQ